MSVWEDHDVEDKVIEILSDVHLVNDYHHFGRPYMTAYQLAIRLHARYPGVAQALGVKVGGVGTGERTSLAQYLARELSRRIKSDPYHRVQGAFLSNEAVRELTYEDADGQLVTSSLTGTSFDLSLYRLRASSADQSDTHS
jgi:hypothetical protein